MARPQGDVTITIDKELKKKIEDKLKAARNEGSNLPHYRSAKAFVALAVDVALNKKESELTHDILDTAIGNAVLLYETECNRARDAERALGREINFQHRMHSIDGRGTLVLLEDLEGHILWWCVAPIVDGPDDALDAASHFRDDVPGADAYVPNPPAGSGG